VIAEFFFRDRRIDWDSERIALSVDGVPTSSGQLLSDLYLDG
jgi:hypothetical protein